MVGDGSCSESSACMANAYGFTAGVAAGVVGADPLGIQGLVVVVPPLLVVQTIEYQLPGVVTPGGGPTSLFKAKPVDVQTGTKDGAPPVSEPPPTVLFPEVDPVAPGELASDETPTEMVPIDSVDVAAAACAEMGRSMTSANDANTRTTTDIRNLRTCLPQSSGLPVSNHRVSTA